MNQLRAVQAANDALNELNIDTSRPVDPFEAIERAGLRLGFKQLDALLGAILPGDPAGVLINSDRPRSLQCYTAAHELGHWFLHQDSLRFDTDATVVGRRGDPRELEAQTFAAHFLMPLDLVYSTAHAYGIARGRPAEAESVYQLARDMQVSFEAAVRHLATCKIVSATDRDDLLKKRPGVIKNQLTGGGSLADNRGDVWLVDGSHDGAALEVFVGDTILVRLDERPATGYRWLPGAEPDIGSVHQLRREPAGFAGGTAFSEKDRPLADVVPFPRPDSAVDIDAALTLLGDEPAPPRPPTDPVVIGGRTQRQVRYAASAPGRDRIQLRQVRPFAPRVALATLEVTALVRPSPELEHRVRYLEAFRRAEAEGGG